MAIMMGLALGAAVGGGMAALQKKDILQGALIGGATGAISGGIGSFGGAAGAAGEGIAGATASGLGSTAGGAGASAFNVASNAALPAMELGGSTLAGAVAPSMGAEALSGQALPQMAGESLANPYLPTPITTQAPLSAANGYDAFKADPMKYLGDNKIPLGIAGMAGGMFAGNQSVPSSSQSGTYQPYRYNQSMNPQYTGAGTPMLDQSYTKLPGINFAAGGIAALADGGQLEPNGINQNQMYPMAQINPSQYATATQSPQQRELISGDSAVDPTTGQELPGMADGGIAAYQAYGSNNKAVPQAVTDYNNMLSDRAQQEYVQQAQLAAMVPQQNRQGIMPMARPANLTPINAAPAPEANPQQNQQPGGHSEAYYNDTMSRSGGQANGGLMHSYAQGGGVDGGYSDAQSNLGGYSDGGRLLKGPGTGISDDIPGVVANKQPVRLANGEFIIPARIVSELGSGSTDAGAKRLYDMMDRVQKARGKTVGKSKVAFDAKAHKELNKL